MNTLIFLAQTSIIGISALIALQLGKEALVAFICTQCVLANLFVTKQITLFGFNATASDAFTIGAVLGLNLLQEYYGKNITKKAVWISFFILIFYAIMSQIQLIFVPSSFDVNQPHFYAILYAMPRITVASFSVYLFVQHLDRILYGYLKKLFNNEYLVARNYLSIGLCQLVDTILFSFLGLYGIVQNLGSIILISYTIKMVALFMTTPFLMMAKKLGVHHDSI